MFIIAIILSGLFLKWLYKMKIKKKIRVPYLYTPERGVRWNMYPRIFCSIKNSIRYHRRIENTIFNYIFCEITAV